ATQFRAQPGVSIFRVTKRIASFVLQSSASSAELNQSGAAGRYLVHAPVALLPQHGKRGGLLLNGGVRRYRKDQPGAITGIRREAGLEELVKKRLDWWRYGKTDPILGTFLDGARRRFPIFARMAVVSDALPDADGDQQG